MTKGPFDKYRSQKPDDVPQEFWDDQIHAQNDWYNGLPDEIQGTYDKVLSKVSPEQFADKIREQPGYKAAAKEEEFYGGNDELINKILDKASAETADNKSWVDQNLAPRLGDLDQAIQRADSDNQGALDQQRGARDELKGELDRLAKDAGKSANRFNEFSGDAYDRYAGEQRGLNERDRAAEGRYLGETDDLLSQLKSHDYVGDVAADQEGLGAQRDALDFAKGAAGGDLDWESEAAQAFADPNAVKQQQEGLDLLRQDIKSGDADQRDSLARIKADLATGGAEQRDLLSQLKEMSASPEISAKERLIGELARREFETADKSNRDAVSASLAARGIRSGGQQIAGQRAAGQQIAQDRLLKELGMQASALDRQLGALNQRGQVADALRTGDQRGLSLLSDQTGDIRAANQAAVGEYVDATGQLRGQTFDEAFGRGSAADLASKSNQGARLTGGQMQGDLANQLRSDADTLAMNNQNQKGISERFQDSYAQQEADRVAGVAKDRNTVSMNTTAQEGDRYNDVYGAEQNMLNTNYGREKDARDASWEASTAGYDADSDVNAFQADTADKGVARAQGAINAGTQISNTRSGLPDPEDDALKLVLGERYNRYAAGQAKS